MLRDQVGPIGGLECDLRRKVRDGNKPVNLDLQIRAFYRIAPTSGFLRQILAIRVARPESGPLLMPASQEYTPLQAPWPPVGPPILRASSDRSAPARIAASEPVAPP